MTPRDILSFWYEPEMQSHWFKSTPEIDDTIRLRFESLWQMALDGQLDDWQESAAGCLALAIILDQFPLNMFRGEARSFASEAKAIETTKYAISQDYHHEIDPQQVAFLIMPLMHSENMDDQNLSVQLFDELALEGNLRFAQHHRSIVERFGRFPHRNAILGRESTPAELEYLNSKEAFTG